MTYNLANAFVGLAEHWPGRVAIETSESKLTFSGLVLKASGIAELLRRRGVGPGDRIGIAQTNNAEAFVLMLGTWLCGATAMVVDFRTRAIERKGLADELQVKFFVEDRAAPGTDKYMSVRNDSAWDAEMMHASPCISSPAGGSQVAVIGVSSGTSGTPQAVALSHSCLYMRAALVRTSPQWQRQCRLLACAPLSFTATRMNVLSCLLDGGSVYFAPVLISSQQLAETIESSRATAMLTVPTTVRGLMELAGSRPLFPSLEYLMCCGAPMSAGEKVAAQQILTRGFLENYGSTMAGMLTLLESKDIEAHGSSVGRPLPHVLIQVVDNQDSPLPIGEVGVIRARTPGVAEPLSAAGCENERRTSDLLIDGWIYPGDIGLLDEDGYLRIVGRTSDMIVRGGTKIYPSEVESVLAEHSAIAEAAVVGWPDRMLGEEIAAFVVLRSKLQPQEILAYCRSKLHPDKQPREIFIVDAMPRNANGKLVKRELIDRLPPRDPLS